MHHPPAVSFPITRLPVVAGIWLGLMGLAMLGGLMWAHGSEQPGWRWFGFLALSLLSLAWGIRAWRHTPCGVLAWNGESWAWRENLDECPVEVNVRLDFQSLVLLELVFKPNKSTWVWLQQLASQSQWADLRRALHGRLRQPADDRGLWHDGGKKV